MKSHRLITLASAATLTLAGLGFAACSATKQPDVGGLMVIVSTDGKLEVETLEVTVWQNTKTSERTTRSYASKTFTLPNTIAVVSNGDPTTTAFVRVTARNKLGTVVDIRDTVVQEVPTERLAALSIVLSVSCSGKVTPAGESSCLEGESCDPRSGTCKSAIVKAGSLGTYVAGSELDAGVDSTVDVVDSNDTKMLDDGIDSAVDSLVDSGTIDSRIDSAVDSGTIDSTIETATVDLGIDTNVVDSGVDILDASDTTDANDTASVLDVRDSSIPDLADLGDVPVDISADTMPIDSGPDTAVSDTLDDTPCTAPTVPTVSTCGTSWDRRPIVEFTPVPSGITYEIWRSGDSSPLGTTSLVGQNYFRPVSAIDAGLPVPGKNVDLYVKACKSGDPTCCATSAMTTSKLVESCTTPVAASSSNVLFSEYIIDGDGGACSGPACDAGESIEITNLSNCPVTLSGTHFSYATSSGGTFRWMDFGAAEVIPPRGVYVAVRNRAASTCPFPFLAAESSGLYGLKVSALAMQGSGLDNGWFGNSGTGGRLRIATGAWPGNMTAGTTIALVTPYKTSAECSGTGFDAINSCGELAAGSTVSTSLTPNQMGRLWHPCSAVVGPIPSSCE